VAGNSTILTSIGRQNLMAEALLSNGPMLLTSAMHSTCSDDFYWPWNTALFQFLYLQCM